MFTLNWTDQAIENFQQVENQAKKTKKNQKSKSSRQEGLLKQVKKTLRLLRENPRHPGLQTHEYSSFNHPWNNREKVFEAYVQNRTSAAYRIFWCYGPDQKEITILAITQHP